MMIAGTKQWELSLHYCPEKLTAKIQDLGQQALYCLASPKACKKEPGPSSLDEKFCNFTTLSFFTCLTLLAMLQCKLMLLQSHDQQ